MFVIAVGSPFDGIHLFGTPDESLPFLDVQEAAEAAEKEFPSETWFIVELCPLGTDD